MNLKRYRGDNDGKYVHQGGSSGVSGGSGGSSGSGRNLVVSIGRNRAPPTKATTTPPPPPPPIAPIVIVDPRNYAPLPADPAPSGADEPEIKILRQEHEETENGYRYV